MDPEKNRLKAMKYLNKNRKKVQRRNRKKYADNREAFAAKSKKYYWEHRDHILDQIRDRRAKNK